jgi:zinc protease
MPTEQPFVYLISATAAHEVPLADVEAAATQALDQVTRQGVLPTDVAKAKNQLRARLVFDDDSVTNLAHQIGYYATIADVDLYDDLVKRIAAVTEADVERVARKYLRPAQRTVGWFEPQATAVPAGS